MEDRRPAPRYQGRLELTWTNKDQALLWSEDGSYRWVPASDYRIAEVRLLHDAGEVGEVGPTSSRAADNLLIRGDALHALTSLARIPEFQREYLGKVKLAYLDPPFNTQQAFEQYDDALEHSVWLTMMRDRLLQIKRLLREDGSIYVHCDSTEVHYLKVMMDEVFGRDCFRSEIIWKRTSAHSSAKRYGPVHDTILFYSKSEEYAWNQRFEPYDQYYLDQFYTHVDDSGRRWRRSDLTGAGVRRGATGQPWRGIDVTSKGRHWSLPPDELEKLDIQGKIHWPQKEGGMPMLRRYADEQPGVPLQDVWSDIRVMHNLSVERLGFDTQKPEALLQRIIAVSSDPGDIVLDCFLGSGTTAAVAHKMGRRWVGVERSAETLSTYAVPRLQKVVSGDDPGGISEGVGWKRGGGFRILDVAPSMFVESGEYVVLADWAVNGHLAEATAAQLGFEFRYDPPFCGIKGRSVLCVVDGLVTIEVVDLIASRLEETERVVICGTAIAEGADAALKAVSSGSRVRRIPASILADYRRSTPRLIRTRQPEVDPDGAAAGAMSAGRT